MATLEYLYEILQAEAFMQYLSVLKVSKRYSSVATFKFGKCCSKIYNFQLFFNDHSMFDDAHVLNGGAEVKKFHMHRSRILCPTWK